MTKNELLEAIRSARAELDTLLSELGKERMEEPGAMGEWSAKDMLAHFGEWDRWNFAQLRAAIDGGEPVYVSWSVEYPEDARGNLQEDVRNRLIHDDARKRSVDDVMTKFSTIADAFADWLEGRSDEDVAEPIAFVPSETSQKWYQKASDHPEVPRSLPFWRMAGDQIAHWRLHMTDLERFVRGGR